MNTLQLLAHGIEVLLNTFEDYLRLALAEFPNKPFDRIVVVFRIVAARFTAFSCMAQRNHIRCDRSRVVWSWIAQRYPMVNRDSVPKSSRATADSTAIMPIRKHVALLFARKSVWQTQFASSSPMGGDDNIRPSQFRLLASFIAFLFPLPINRVSSASLSFVCINFLSACRISLGRTLFSAFAERWISGIKSIVSRLRMVNTSLSILLIVSIMLPRPLSVARTTVGAKERARILLVHGEEYFSCEVFMLATCTEFEGIRKVEHSVSLSLHHMRVLADGVISRRFGLQTLANNQIVSQIGAES